MSGAASKAGDATPHRPLRIAHVALSALPATVGGLEIVVDNLVRHQRQLGHEVALITRWQQARAARSAGADYPVYALPPYRALSRTPFRGVPPRLPMELALAWHGWQHKFDVLHAHWLYPTAWLAERAARVLGVTLVATAHGADLQTEQGSAYGYRQFPEGEQRLRAVAPRLDAAIAISPALAERLAEIGIAPSRIHDIPNGVDIHRFGAAAAARAETRAKLGIGPETTLLLSVGRNQPSKGLGVLPEVLGLLRNAGHHAVCCIVGAGVSELAARFDALGLASHVRLVEAIRPPEGSLIFPPDELVALYGAADAFVFPSLTEGAPLVALEAMAAGLPVVGNDVQGIRDAVTHEVTGLLCPPRDPHSMASQVARLIEDRALARKLADAGQAAARAHDWSVVAASHCELYRTLLERPAA